MNWTLPIASLEFLAVFKYINCALQLCFSDWVNVWFAVYRPNGLPTDLRPWVQVRPENFPGLPEYKALPVLKGWFNYWIISIWKWKVFVSYNILRLIACKCCDYNANKNSHLPQMINPLVYRILREWTTFEVHVCKLTRSYAYPMLSDFGKSFVCSYVYINHCITMSTVPYFWWTSYLLHLKLDGGAHFLYFLHHVVIVGQCCGKLASFVQTRSQDTRNLSDETVRGQESIILFGWN